MDINPLHSARKQLGKTARILGLKSDALEALCSPARVVEVTIPVEHDDGTFHFYAGYRVQHNNARGPFKGGLRFHMQVHIDEVKALALWMAIKTAVVNIPYGGGKGGVIVDPQNLTEGELERLSRGFVRTMFDVIGPEKDIPAPDVNTNPNIMKWMADEYSTMAGTHTPAAFTGKPVEEGGSEGRDSATGQGGFYTLQNVQKKIGFKPKETRVIVQGLGNVGYHFARLAHHAGYKIIGVSDSRGGIYDPAGFNPDNVERVKREKGSVYDYAPDKKLSNEELLTRETDILVPAALENVITRANVDTLNTHVVLELANGPTVEGADEKLVARDILLVPDVLANAGGVTVSYFEWYQNMHNETWTEREVLEKLKPIMDEAFEIVWKEKETRGIDMRTAAYMVALERIVKAMRKQGTIS